MLKKSILLCAFIISNALVAGEYFGVQNIPESKTIEGQELKLNGVGLRKATFLKIKVYAGALYTSQPVRNDQEVAKVPFPAHIDMHFVRNVDKSDIVKAWDVAFKNTHKIDASKYETLQTLNKMMADLKKDTVMSFTFLNEKVLVMVPGQAVQEIKSSTFGRELLQIWFKDAEDRGLRAGMLGIKE